MKGRFFFALTVVASAQVSEPFRFHAGNQTLEIVPAFERQMEFISAVRRAGAGADRPHLYSKLVSEPVLQQCAAGGEYADLGKWNISQTPADLETLTEEIVAIRRSGLNVALEAGLRRAAELLPGPDTTVCVLAAYPAAANIKSDMHGVSGITAGAGKIWLIIYPVSGLEDWARYTVAHEYHHSAWTARHFNRSTPDDLLSYLVFEGRADSFAHTAYPHLDVPWNQALTRDQETQVWRSIEGKLSTTDFTANRAVMFGGQDLPHWAGYTIGFEIVESYRKRHPEVSVADWTAIAPRALLEGSDFAFSAK